MRLAWSPDATQVYLQTVERDLRAGSVKVRHYLLGLDGQPPKGADQEPPWASKYWAWKSAQAAPGLPSMKINVGQQRRPSRECREERSADGSRARAA